MKDILGRVWGGAGGARGALAAVLAARAPTRALGKPQVLIMSYTTFRCDSLIHQAMCTTMLCVSYQPTRQSPVFHLDLSRIKTLISDDG